MEKPKPAVFIFCDASFDAARQMGVGASLLLSEQEYLRQLEISDSRIQTVVIHETNIARLEIRTALWALANAPQPAQISLYTDCKTMEGLPLRRAKLEAVQYRSKRRAKTLANADLYQDFFSLYDRLHPTIRWLKGHAPSKERSHHQQIFAAVDSAARQALRRCR